MPIQKVELERQILKVTFAGKIAFREAVELWKDVLDRAAGQHAEELLLDLLGAEADLSTHERYEMGQEIAEYARMQKIRLKIAVAGVPPVVDGFGALVARNRGQNVKVFPSVELALEWLRSFRAAAAS